MKYSIRNKNNIIEANENNRRNGYGGGVESNENESINNGEIINGGNNQRNGEENINKCNQRNEEIISVMRRHQQYGEIMTAWRNNRK
jgi:hypothetical protein